MNWKIYSAMAALALMIIFVLQNMDVVSVEFLIWQIQASRVIIYLSMFLIGALLGWLACSLHRRQDKRWQE